MSESEWRMAEHAAHWLIAWSVVVVLVVAANAIARPRRPSVRYAGWLLAAYSGIVLAIPAIWVSPVLTWNQLTEQLQIQPALLQRSAPQSKSQRTYEPLFDLRNEQHPVTSTPGVVRTNVPHIASATPGGVRSVSAARVPSAGSVTTFVMFVWIVGVLVGVIRLGYGGWRAHSLVRSADQAVPAELAEELLHVRGELGIRRNVQLKCHKALKSPVCVGLGRPVVLWPCDDTPFCVRSVAPRAFPSRAI